MSGGLVEILLPVVISASSRKGRHSKDGYYLDANGDIQKPVGWGGCNIFEQFELYWLVTDQALPPGAFRVVSLKRV